MRDVSILFIVNSVANNFRHRKEPWSAFETPELCLGDYVLSQVPNNFSKRTKLECRFRGLDKLLNSGKFFLYQSLCPPVWRGNEARMRT
ncbi:hypothetical protein ECG_00269 [Echinococcus granulosus]|nr:hypothetical protein ECG_00269 [Echinococcus granulosus]